MGFEYRETMGENKVEHLSVIAVSGDGAHAFLQRQLTTNLDQIVDSRCCLSAYLNPNGRVIANFWLLLHQQFYILVVPQSLQETLANRLKMFVLRDKVTIDIDSGLNFVGVSKLVNNIDETRLTEDYATVSTDDVTFVRIPGSKPRYGVLGKDTILKKSFDVENIISQTDWNRENIRVGIPFIEQANSGEFVAQAVNLDLLKAIDWNKGCFPGQEIVARLHYRGRTNRRVVPATISQRVDIPVGSSIHCPALAGKQVGHVVNHVPADIQSPCELLASVPLKFVGQDSILLNDSIPIELNNQALPYHLPELSS